MVRCPSSIKDRDTSESCMTSNQIFWVSDLQSLCFFFFFVGVTSTLDDNTQLGFGWWAISISIETNHMIFEVNGSLNFLVEQEGQKSTAVKSEVPRVSELFPFQVLSLQYKAWNARNLSYINSREHRIQSQEASKLPRSWILAHLLAPISEKNCLIICPFFCV